MGLVLAGTVVALPTHLRVRAELIRVSDHVQLWLEDFLIQRGAGFMFDVSVEAQAIGEQAAVRISAAIEARLRSILSNEGDASKVAEENLSARQPARREAPVHSAA